MKVLLEQIVSVLSPHTGCVMMLDVVHCQICALRESGCCFMWGRTQVHLTRSLGSAERSVKPESTPEKRESPVGTFC